jgi:hypothetical protein
VISCTLTRLGRATADFSFLAQQPLRESANMYRDC